VNRSLRAAPRGRKRWCWRTTAWRAGRLRCPMSTSRTTPTGSPLHRAFHRALIAGCESRWLLNFCDQLADQRYHRLSAPRSFAKRGVKSEHQQLMDAIAGFADEAVALRCAHYQRIPRRSFLTIRSCLRSERLNIINSVRSSIA